MISRILLKDKKILSWALYDWANSAFATTVMAGFFPIFFKEYWSHGQSVTESSFHLGLSNSVSSLCLAILAPFLGALADLANLKKIFMLICAGAGIGATACLFWIPMGDWQLALLCYAIAAFGFSAANVFYDATLVEIAPKSKLDVISGWGYSLGYLGGGLLFSVNVVMTLKPQYFHLENGAIAVRISFLMVSIWWALFTIPFVLYVREGERKTKESLAALAVQSFRHVLQTIRKLGQYKNLVMFLVAYLFYIDGVNTIIKMAVDYGMAIGFDKTHLITALLIVQFVGFPAAIGFGFLGQKIGAKSGILIGLFVYCLVTIYAHFMVNPYEFYILAATIGLVQGGVQSLSRSYYAAVIPPEHATEFFGFFNMLGKFSAIFGPVLVGLVSNLSGDPRLSILVILLFLIVGGGLLLRVPQQR